MRLNRLIIILSIIGAGVFASYFGGNIPYALFYLTILIPVIAFLYTLYVYIRFKIYQKMGSIMVVKGDWTEYSFMICNEDFVTFRNIKVNFLKDKSIIEDTGVSTEFSLLPSEKEGMKTRIKCNYRGEYEVGVDSVEVTDFLYLFSITYPIGTKLKAVVLPRVVEIDKLGIAPPQVDVKNPVFHSNQAEEELDTELRKYSPGDNRKRINWKASAKTNELLSRKYLHRPKAEILLFMDLFKIKENELQIIAVEDKIIEIILAIANYYSLSGMGSHIIYDEEGHKQVLIRAKRDFNVFYKACAKINFKAKTPVSELIRLRMLRGDEGLFVVAATHFLTKELYLTALQVIASGNYICVMFISDDVSDATKAMLDSMRLAGAAVYQIMSEDEIEDVLARQVFI